MRILHVGTPSVVEPLRALGHEVIVAFEAFPAETQSAPGRPFDVRPLWRRLDPAPDLLLVVQQLSVQELPYGIEDVPAPRLYWAIDVHLNHFWQRHYGRLFDLVLVPQRDWVPVLAADGVAAHWLPWAAEEPYATVPLDLPRPHDVAFVGTVDPVTRPKRAAALALLRRHFRVATFGERVAERLSPEAAARVFASSKLVFNESILGDVNFRVFEAMAAGALLVTERVGNGLTELFTPGEHLAVFGPEDLVATVERYLASDEERRRVAARGAAEVRGRHTMTARMADLAALVERGVARRETRPGAPLAWGLTCHLTMLRGLADPAHAAPLAVESLRAVAGEGTAPEASLALAEMLVWAGREEGALAVLAGTPRGGPGDLRAPLMAAEIERRRGRPAEAARIVREAVRAAPLDPATRALALAAADGGLDGAAALHALGLVVQETGVPIVPGLVTQVKDDLPRCALDYHQRALALDPGHRGAATSAAATLELAGMAEFAVPFHAAAVRAAPADPGARAGLGRALARSYRLEEAGHQGRVLDALAGRPVRGGSPPERAAAYREALTALVASPAPPHPPMALRPPAG